MNSSNFIRNIKSYDWMDISKSFLYALVLAMLFRSFLFEFYKIPSGSMIPELREGDHLFISKYNYGYSKYSFSPFPIPLFEKRIFFKPPERGDIIVFKLPLDSSTNYIKRLIGLPGDEIQMKEGLLYINGKPVIRDKIGDFEFKDKDGKTIYCEAFEETLPNGLTYKILRDKRISIYSSHNNTQVFKIPSGHYFFIGDNRDHSLDSRFLNKVGYVPVENLVGRAAFLVFTSDLSLWKLITEGNAGRSFQSFKYAD
ncbi:signal peptidase I [endosymbiont of Acanthamoeba sp. UWC8]|uniref:signal peptidase I n=1 Tax=endosymbiont of Acanthamoeba sp. UWC8 TaxID=86106 RepID=UPI0004D0E00D|nr:signal peptidase I [endosymbiont of Acanthamoeba sp. UWC8]AIF80806.1 signal peptidase I [endosymbiont of Acanthamoeba sp. UWC8]